MTFKNPSHSFLATVLTLATLTYPVAADWPSARQNARRTAAANGTSALVTPTPFWRFFHGGTLDAGGALFIDVNNDGSTEVVLAGAEGLSAKSPINGDALWLNKDLGGAAAARLAGLADVDGDGVAELVAHTGTQAFLVRLSDGATLWAETPGEMGTLSAIRIGDLSGDGHDDLVIHECGCCALNSGKSAVAYRFAGSGASVAKPKLMWTPPAQFCGGSQSGTVAHMRSATKSDFVFGTGDHLELLDGPTGAVVATMPTFGVAVQASQCEPLDIDGDALDELLCVLNDTSGTPNNGRRAFLVKYAASPSPTLTVVWQTLVGTEDGGVRIPPNFIGDLDGDGKLEFALGGKTSPTEWTTYVYDAATGAERAKVTAAEPAGIAPILAGKANALLTESNGALSAWRLEKGVSGKLEARWTLANHATYATIDVNAGKRSSIRQRLVLLDHDGDGTAEVAATDTTNGSLAFVRDSGASAAVTGNHTPPGASTLLAVWPVNNGGQATVGVAQSDGNAHVLDQSLAPVSGNTSYGAQFGNYFSDGQFRLLWNYPIVGDLGDGTPGVLLVNSRGALQRLDARKASFADAPSVIWTRERTRAAQIVAGLDTSVSPAKPGLFAFERKLGINDRVLALRADGTLLWSKETLGYVLADMVVGELNGDTVPDVIVEHGEPTNTLHRVTAYSGATGAVLWTAAPIGPGNRQPPGGALGDWNGDGTDDFVLEADDKTIVLNGLSGMVLQQSALGGYYYSPILYDVDNAGEYEVTLYAGYTPPATINHALSNYLWQGTGADRPLTYGAMTRCGQAGMLLGGSWASPSSLSRIVAGGASAGTRSEHTLAGGSVFANVASANGAKAKTGQLASPAIHENLAGDGVAVAVVGSADGWLYGIEACTGGLRFAHAIGAPVGAVAFGDTDGDGSDDLIASAADGYLYAFRQANVAAPVAVLDTDPLNGDTMTDVDAIVTQSTLYARWDSVPGAESYEVAAVRDAVDGGGFVSAGPWTDVGALDEAQLAGLTLVEGHRYFVAVRARIGTQYSPDTLSDGVRVYFNALPSGAGGGGGAGGSSTANSAGPTSGAGGGETTSGAGGAPAAGAGGGTVGNTPECECTCAVSATSGPSSGENTPLAWSALALALAAMRRRCRFGTRRPATS